MNVWIESHNAFSKYNRCIFSKFIPEFEFNNGFWLVSCPYIVSWPKVKQVKEQSINLINFVFHLGHQ
jgi:hypothetical protein